jgi:hypothetical protein
VGAGAAVVVVDLLGDPPEVAGVVGAAVVSGTGTRVVAVVLVVEVDDVEVVDSEVASSSSDSPRVGSVEAATTATRPSKRENTSATRRTASRCSVRIRAP